MFVTCRMEASLPRDPETIYEMEDQRNWTDASYKTYVCSLLDPWPFRLEAGDKVAQRVTLVLRGTSGRHRHRRTGGAVDAALRRRRGGPRAGDRPRRDAATPGRRRRGRQPARCALRPQFITAYAVTGLAGARGDPRRLCRARRGPRRRGPARTGPAGGQVARSGACSRGRSLRQGGSEAGAGHRLPGTLPQVDAAGRPVAGGRRPRPHLQPGPQGLPGRDGPRRHAQLLHRAQPQAPAGRDHRRASPAPRPRSSMPATITR